jgi:phosphate/sulfate permease
MRTVGLAMFVLGLVLAFVFLVIGVCCRVPWSTSSAVLFGFGVAYAGLCGVRSVGAEQTVPQ